MWPLDLLLIWWFGVHCGRAVVWGGCCLDRVRLRLWWRQIILGTGSDFAGCLCLCLSQSPYDSVYVCLFMILSSSVCEYVWCLVLHLCLGLSFSMIIFRFGFISVRLSVYAFMYVCASVYLSVFLPLLVMSFCVYLCTHTRICLCVCLSVCLFVCLTVCLSVALAHTGICKPARLVDDGHFRGWSCGGGAEG